MNNNRSAVGTSNKSACGADLLPAISRDQSPCRAVSLDARGLRASAIARVVVAALIVVSLPGFAVGQTSEFKRDARQRDRTDGGLSAVSSAQVRRPFVDTGVLLGRRMSIDTTGLPHRVIHSVQSQRVSDAGTGADFVDIPADTVVTLRAKLASPLKLSPTNKAQRVWMVLSATAGAQLADDLQRRLQAWPTDEDATANTKPLNSVAVRRLAALG